MIRHDSANSQIPYVDRLPGAPPIDRQGQIAVQLQASK
jgi:hypothetical protein